MKRVLSFFLVLLMMSFPLSASCEAEEAESLRLSLQEHYGITILMGDECQFDPSEKYQIVGSVATPFQQIAFGNSRFTEMLQLLDDVLSVYPPDFFSSFKWTRHYGGLLFMIVDDILMGEEPIGGLQAGADSDGRIVIYLSRISVKERAIHHEIGHAVDYRIRWKFPDAYTDWNKLNPEGFIYTNDFSVIMKDSENLEPDDWFVREYSKIDEFEDRATVFEALMTKDAAWWSARAVREQLRFT